MRGEQSSIKGYRSEYYYEIFLLLKNINNIKKIVLLNEYNKIDCELHLNSGIEVYQVKDGSFTKNDLHDIVKDFTDRAMGLGSVLFYVVVNEDSRSQWLRKVAHFLEVNSLKSKTYDGLKSLKSEHNDIQLVFRDGYYEIIPFFKIIFVNYNDIRDNILSLIHGLDDKTKKFQYRHLETIRDRLLCYIIDLIGRDDPKKELTPEIVYDIYNSIDNTQASHDAIMEKMMEFRKQPLMSTTESGTVN